MRTIGRQGFTLIEMVIVVAIVALLAGILVPVAFNQVDDAEQARTTADVRQLSSALLLFRSDTGQWPGSSVKLLYSDGNAATDESKFDSATAEHLLNPLRDNKDTVNNWAGPYMTAFAGDPWGNRYIVEVDGFSANGSPYAWVISAGPDGKFQTAKEDTGLKGDDIGLIMN